MSRCILCRTVVEPADAAYVVHVACLCRPCVAVVGKSVRLNRETAERMVRMAIRAEQRCAEHGRY